MNVKSQYVIVGTASSRHTVAVDFVRLRDELEMLGISRSIKPKQARLEAVGASGRRIYSAQILVVTRHVGELRLLLLLRL